MKGLRLWLMVATLLTSATTVHAMPPLVAFWQALQVAGQHCQQAEAQSEARCQAAQCPAAGQTSWFVEGVQQTLANWQRLRSLCTGCADECPQTEGCREAALGVAAKVGSSCRTLGCRTDSAGYARDAQGQKPACCAGSTGPCNENSAVVGSIVLEEKARAAAPCCCAKACACCETCKAAKKETAHLELPSFSVWASVTVDVRVGPAPSSCPFLGAGRMMPLPTSPVWAPVIPQPVAVPGCRATKGVMVVPPVPLWIPAPHPAYGCPAPPPFQGCTGASLPYPPSHPAHVCPAATELLPPPLQACVPPEVIAMPMVSGRVMLPAPAQAVPVQVVRRQVQAAAATTPRAQQAHLVTPDLDARCERMVHMGETILLEGNVRLESRRNGKPLRIEAQRVIVNTVDGTLTVESDAPSKGAQNDTTSESWRRAQVIPVPVQENIIPVTHSSEAVPGTQVWRATER